MNHVYRGNREERKKEKKGILYIGEIGRREGRKSEESCI
jgi:hypothetical protein